MLFRPSMMGCASWTKTSLDLRLILIQKHRDWTEERYCSSRSELLTGICLFCFQITWIVKSQFNQLDKDRRKSALSRTLRTLREKTSRCSADPNTPHYSQWTNVCSKYFFWRSIHFLGAISNLLKLRAKTDCKKTKIQNLSKRNIWRKIDLSMNPENHSLHCTTAVLFS